MPVAIYWAKRRSVMKKKNLKADFNIPKSFALLFLAIFLLFYFSGCATMEVYKYAKEKAAPHYEYWEIKSVVSATKQENGDISVCVELNSPDGTEAPKLNTITLPLAVLAGETNAVESFGFRPVMCPFEDGSCYSYPIEKSQNDCKIGAQEDLSATSFLPIERLEVQNKDRNQLHDLLDSYNNYQQVTEKIYEVSFVSDVADTEENTNNHDSNGVADNKEKGSKDTLLIYWPVKNDHQYASPIQIANLHEDISTNIYYVAVPVVFVVEAAVITVALGLCGGQM
jgi:hypothetical protein